MSDVDFSDETAAPLAPTEPFLEPPGALAARLAPRFDLPRPIEAYDFAERGNINQHTFLIRAGSEPRELLLQRINHQVFVRPRSVMRAMLACLEAQRAGLAAGLVPDDLVWEPITLVPTRTGAPFLEHVDRRGGTVWRMMVRIGEAKTYKSLGELPDTTEQLRIAEEAGRGLALFGDLTASIDASQLVNPLPGYRDTKLYYQQLHAVLEGCRTLEQAAPRLPDDPVVRQSTQLHFRLHLPDDLAAQRRQDSGLQEVLALALAEESFGLTLADAMRSGRIRTVAIHGDTKLDNFLFSTTTGRVKSLVDLDTIMPHTWLADWGDMVRSLANVAGEKETDVARIQVNREVYLAMAKGFLSTARAATEEELGLMLDAVEIITLELGVRFLADYLRGDSYFRLGSADPPHLNRTRALAQLTLFQRLRAARDELADGLAALRVGR